MAAAAPHHSTSAGPPPNTTAPSDAPPGASLQSRSSSDPFDAVRVPPLERQLGARVEHVVITAGGPLSALLAARLQLPAPLFVELMRFGAVYYAPVMPKPNDKAPMSANQLAAAREAREAAMKVIPLFSRDSGPACRLPPRGAGPVCVASQAARARPAHTPSTRPAPRLAAAASGRCPARAPRRAPQAWGPSPTLQVPRRVLQDQQATPGGYARVHLQPKRFPAAYRYV